MCAKRAAALLLLFMVAALTGGCASNDVENAATVSLSADNGATGGGLTYLSEKLALPAGFEGTLDKGVSSGELLFLTDGDKLYCMGKDASFLQEVSAYAPLEGYTIGALGAALGSGLLVMETGGESTIISRVAEDGTVDFVTDITSAVAGYDNFLPQSFFSDEDGNIYAQTDDCVLLIGADGERAYELIPESNSEVAGIAMSGGGEACVLIHEKLKSVYTVYRLNPDGSLGGGLFEMPEAQIPPQLFNGGTSFDLLYSDYDELYAIDTENKSAEPLFEWVTHGLTGPFVFDVWDMSGRVLICRNYTNELISFQEGAEDPRTVLRLAIYGESFILPQIISEFNMNSDTYKIVVEDYARYDEGVDGAGLMKLNTEIQAGKIPDMIDFAYIPAGDYEEQGLLTDLYPFIDADPELNRSDLLAPYIRAFERGGALYQALMSFALDGFIGKSDIVGTEHGWTLDEMLALQAQYAPGAPGMGGLSRDAAAGRYIDCIYTEFIDWETGECSFDSDEFVKIIDYLATLDESIDDDKRRVTYLLDGEKIISPITWHNVIHLMSYDVVFGNIKYTIKGYPTNGKNGIACSYTNSPALGITTACTDPEGAWSFVRTLFSEYIGDSGIGLPTCKKALDVFNAKWMTENTWINEDGEEVVEWKFVGGLVDNEIDPNIMLYAATQEQVDRFYELIDACDLVWGKDDTITDIAKEELGPFFAGNRTARETANRIQSRVQLYVAERKG